MNDLQRRINNITCILASDLTKAQKVVEALQQFSGLDITHFNKAAKNSIHKHLIVVNKITANYPIKTDDDYRLITDKHLGDILKSIQSLCLDLLVN